MVNEISYFLLRLVLSALNLVLDYLIQPLPRWQVQLVRVAALISGGSALALLASGAGRSSFAAFFLVFLISRPIPPKHRWLWPIAMSLLTFVTIDATCLWLQVHGLL
jgi:hypothetical protein